MVLASNMLCILLPWLSGLLVCAQALSKDTLHSKSTTVLFSPPEDFVFACASSAYQVEGHPYDDGKGQSIWDAFVHRNPSPIYAGQSGDDAMLMYEPERYIKDFQLYKEAIGAQAYDFTISWPRILPKGRGQVNNAGIKHYVDMIDALHDNGMSAICT